MGKAVPAQHPAVVLRSHYTLVRALLGLAAIAVLGLTAAVVILATDEDTETTIGAASQPAAPEKRWSAYDKAISEMTPQEVAAAFGPSSAAPATRYDGGPEEGTRGIRQSNTAAPVSVNPSTEYPTTRYDGGPEEGTRGGRFTTERLYRQELRMYGLSPEQAAREALPGTRFDGGPEEGSVP